MTSSDQQLFRNASKKTFVKFMIVLVLVTGLAALTLSAGAIEPHMTTAALTMTTTLGAFFVAVAGFLAFHIFVRMPKRLTNLIEALEHQPQRISEAHLQVFHSQLVSADGPGAQWSVQVVIDNGKMSLMPGKRAQAQALLDIIAACAPNAAITSTVATKT